MIEDYFKNFKDYKPWTFALIPTVFVSIAIYLYPRFYTCKQSEDMEKFLENIGGGCNEIARESLGSNILFILLYFISTFSVLTGLVGKDKMKDAAIITMVPTVCLAVLLFAGNIIYEKTLGNDIMLPSQPTIYILTYLLSMFTLNYAIVYHKK